MQRINIYDIYADVCLPKHAHSQATQLALQLGRHPANSAPTIAKPGTLLVLTSVDQVRSLLSSLLIKVYFAWNTARGPYYAACLMLGATVD